MHFDDRVINSEHFYAFIIAVFIVIAIVGCICSVSVRRPCPVYGYPYY